MHCWNHNHSILRLCLTLNQAHRVTAEKDESWRVDGRVSRGIYEKWVPKFCVLCKSFPSYGIMLGQYLVFKYERIQNLILNLPGLCPVYCVNRHLALVENSCSSMVSDSSSVRMTSTQTYQLSALMSRCTNVKSNVFHDFSESITCHTTVCLKLS